MPQYRVLAKSFINNTIVEEGEVIEFDGKAGSNLELIENDKPAAPKGKGKGKGKAAAETVATEEEQGAAE
jgi:hypothetical protein